MKQKRTSQILLVVICIGFIIIGLIVRYYPTTPNRPNLPPLDPLPAAAETPSDEIIPLTVDNATYSAFAIFFLLMPHYPPNIFNFYLEVNVTNGGTSPLYDFDAVKASVFFQNNSHLFTFGLTPPDNYTIAVDEERVLNYENDRQMPVVLSKLQNKNYYLRVLVTYNSVHQVIITSPLANIQVAIE
jgi:hypothetical protein